MWCLSEERTVRIPFIRFFKALMQKARAVEAWRCYGSVSSRAVSTIYAKARERTGSQVYVYVLIFAFSDSQVIRVSSALIQASKVAIETKLQR